MTTTIHEGGVTADAHTPLGNARARNKHRRHTTRSNQLKTEAVDSTRRGLAPLPCSSVAVVVVLVVVVHGGGR